MEQRLTKDFYTINEVAQLFSVTRTTVYDWMNSGRLSYVVVGGRRRIPRDALLAFIRSPNEAEETEENFMPSLAVA